MPRTLAIDPRVPTSHGVVIRRHTLAEQTRAYVTIKEARAYARRIVKEAQLQAESITLEAMQQGFSDGWQDSLNVIYESLQGTKHVHSQIEAALKQSVQDSLEKAMQQPGLELQLIEGWLEAAPPVEATLHLVLPNGAQSQVPAIIRRVEESLKITPTVSIGNSKNIVIESGEQVFEFSPTRTIDELNDLAKSCLRRLEVKKQCAVWSVHVVQHWLSTLAQRYDGVLPDIDDTADVDVDVNQADQVNQVDEVHVDESGELPPVQAQNRHNMPMPPEEPEESDEPDESHELLFRARELYKARQLHKSDEIEDLDDLDYFDGLDDFDDDDEDDD